MARSTDEARRLADQFMKNANSGNNAANDDLVKDLDNRDPKTVDGQVVKRR